jgi:RND family efflux transporter MFP subunit
MSSGVGGGLTDYGDLAGILPSAREEDTRARANTLADETEGRITAPISGVVTDMSLTEKAYALPGIPAVTISSKNDFKVIASVAEADISRLSLGDNARIQSAGYPKKIYYGSVSRIYPSARKTLSGTSTQTVVTIEIILKNSDGNLKPGFSANVEIYGGNDQVLITVPYEAVRQDENNDEYVFVYEDGALKKRPVITGRELTSEVEVLSGITEGSIVIYNPSEAVREGQIIQLKGRAAVD